MPEARFCAADSRTGRDMSVSVSCDFDGTLTLIDVVNTVLDRFAEPSWLHVEAEWRSGVIGSRECLERQTALLRVAPATLRAFVDKVAVDADAAGFFEDCRRRAIDVRVVSDGYDWVIHRVLARLGVRNVPVTANHLLHLGQDRWAVRFPHSAPACGSGVCKCRATDARAHRIHIGDGRSDACVADIADQVFAKGWLLDSRRRRGLACIAFHNFADVRRELGDAVAAAGSRLNAQAPGVTR